MHENATKTDQGSFPIIPLPAYIMWPLPHFLPGTLVYSSDSARSFAMQRAFYRVTTNERNKLWVFHVRSSQLTGSVDLTGCVGRKNDQPPKVTRRVFFINECLQQGNYRMRILPSDIHERGGGVSCQENLLSFSWQTLIHNFLAYTKKIYLF